MRNQGARRNLFFAVANAVSATATLRSFDSESARF
jgi:hypothetical protein